MNQKSDTCIQCVSLISLQCSFPDFRHKFNSLLSPSRVLYHNLSQFAQSGMHFSTFLSGRNNSLTDICGQQLAILLIWLWMDHVSTHMLAVVCQEAVGVSCFVVTVMVYWSVLVVRAWRKNECSSGNIIARTRHLAGGEGVWWWGWFYHAETGFHRQQWIRAAFEIEETNRVTFSSEVRTDADVVTRIGLSIRWDQRLHRLLFSFKFRAKEGLLLSFVFKFEYHNWYGRSVYVSLSHTKRSPMTVVVPHGHQKLPPTNDQVGISSGTSRLVQ